MSVRGVLVSNDSVDSLEEFQQDLLTAPRTPKTPRSPQIFLNRVDYFDSRNIIRGEFFFIILHLQFTITDVSRGKSDKYAVVNNISMHVEEPNKKIYYFRLNDNTYQISTFDAKYTLKKVVTR